jgi:hypothetical protein
MIGLAIIDVYVYEQTMMIWDDCVVARIIYHGRN